MEKGQLVIIIAVAVIASILSSVITANITGNIIRVTPVVAGTDVYTKSEIDAKINTLNSQISSINTQISNIKSWFGSLNVVSIPAGSSVSVDGVSRGTTPSTVYGLSPGSHSVSVSKSGYLPYSSTRTINVGSNYLNVTLTPANTTGTGILYVYTVPSSASLYIDGSYKGLTPYTANLTVGNHIIGITKSGYVNYSTTKYVAAGTNSINVSLTPA